MPKATVKVPLPINVKLRTVDGTMLERVVTFGDFMREMILTDPRFGKDWNTLLIAASVTEDMKALDKAQTEYIARLTENAALAGDPPDWVVDERDFELVYNTAESPQTPYNPIVGVQIIDYVKAIKNASRGSGPIN